MFGGWGQGMVRLLQGRYCLEPMCREVLAAWPHTSHAHLWCRLPSCFPYPPPCPLTQQPSLLPIPHCLSAGLIEEALKQVQEAGMLFVVASGNKGDDLDAQPSFPASSRWVLEPG